MDRIERMRKHWEPWQRFGEDTGEQPVKWILADQVLRNLNNDNYVIVFQGVIWALEDEIDAVHKRY